MSDDNPDDRDNARRDLVEWPAWYRRQRRSGALDRLRFARTTMIDASECEGSGRECDLLDETRDVECPRCGRVVRVIDRGEGLGVIARHRAGGAP